MATITNTGKTPRGLPLLNRKHVEIRPGETKAFPDADFAAIADRKTVKALVAGGHIKVEGFASPAEKPAEPAIEPAMVAAIATFAGDMQPDGAVTAAPKPATAKKKA